MTQTKQIENLQAFTDATDTNLAYELTVSVQQVYRTEGGLCIFTVSDGAQTMKFVAFSKDEKIYSDITKGAIATFSVKQKMHDGVMQGAVNNARLASEAVASAFNEIIASRSDTQHAPKNTTLRLAVDAFKALEPSMLQAATKIRAAIANRRPILITHHGDADGYSAGILLERAITAQITQRQGDVRYLQNFISRNPSRTPYYQLADVTKDIAFFQLNQQRAGTVAPLILIVDNGSTDQDLLAIQKAKLFGADVIVIDHHDPGAKDENGQTPICKNTLVHVNPHLVGIDKNLSASMLCYQVASYIDELNDPSISLATLGGVADKCAGEVIDALLAKCVKDKPFFEELAKYVDFEIYNTKFNHSTGALYELLDGAKQESIMALYKPIMEAERAKIIKTVNNYAAVETIGAYNVALLNGEATTLWGDYYSIGKLAAILHQQNEEKNEHITIVYSNNIIVFRVKQTSAHHFDVNELLAQLVAKIDYARVDGGGHDVAGSIRFVSAAKEEILTFIKDYIALK